MSADPIEHLDIDITRDPAVECPDLLRVVRWMSCPDCQRRPRDPQWTGSRWWVFFPHADDCPQLKAKPARVLPPSLLSRRAS